jgi:hypothetical protein
MPRHGLFRAVFKILHRCLILAGFPNVHVALYAKKWGFLYRVLNDHVAGKAIREAEARGFAAITCGHTHAAMELKRAGRRYLNTGCWTEEPHYYLRVQGERVDLCVFDRSCRRLEGDSEPSADADGPVDRSLRSRPYAASGGASSSAGDAVGAGSAGTEDSP